MAKNDPKSLFWGVVGHYYEPISGRCQFSIFSAQLFSLSARCPFYARPPDSRVLGLCVRFLQRKTKHLTSRQSLHCFVGLVALSQTKKFSLKLQNSQEDNGFGVCRFSLARLYSLAPRNVLPGLPSWPHFQQNNRWKDFFGNTILFEIIEF